ncbi:MAG: Tripartite tricarboxylate transporter family receptor, partial [Deltaproteobacteria bacterium]|nr:Tripartite tricarboxylate transporter family receptor [Deltaproteobacteria bacterium]
KQKVIIDDKVGGGGALGWKELARAKPDGYTVAV